MDKLQGAVELTVDTRQSSMIGDLNVQTAKPELFAVVVKELWLKDKDNDLRLKDKNKNLRSKDKDLLIGPRGQDFPRGLQH